MRIKGTGSDAGFFRQAINTYAAKAALAKPPTRRLKNALAGVQFLFGPRHVTLLFGRLVEIILVRVTIVMYFKITIVILAIVLVMAMAGSAY